MQAITPVTPTDLLAVGQKSKLKFEIYYSGGWIDLAAHNSKNYIESISLSLGGAGMTPDPIGATWGAVILNENSIFHPDHPTAPEKDYLKTSVKARMAIGATYGGTDYFWQRLIGYVNKPDFEAGGQAVSLIGTDYMKLLTDAKWGNLDNYWGTSMTFNSIASDGLVGSEIYAEADAMDINSEANNVTNWTPTNCTFVSFADTGGGSTYVGRLTGIIGDEGTITNLNVGSATAGKEYKVKFKHRGVGEAGTVAMTFFIYQASGFIKNVICYPTDDWIEETLYFTATDTGAIEMRITNHEFIPDLRVDQFSTWEFVPYENRYYELPAASKGPYYVTLDGSPVWQGEEDEGWYHEESTRRVSFDINKTVTNGTNNLIVYYFTAESMENVVADTLVRANYYADRTAALAAMDYTATGITIDKVWFKAGSTCLNAVKLICERCDYRFYFEYDGTPVFKPKPTPGATVFTFTNSKQVISVRNFQDEEEIRNKIVIEGLKQAEPVGRDEALPPELRDEAYDQPSIDAYGERTLTIQNHLFQDLTSITNMCTSLLAERKDPKWYADVEVEYNPVPLQLADKISWEERLSPVLDLTLTGIIRDIKIETFSTVYRCEKL